MSGMENVNNNGTPPGVLTDENEFDEIDHAVMDLVEQGYSRKAACKILGISDFSLKKRIKKLQDESAIILQYKPLQHLQLTNLQAKILENITDEKIEDAPLKDLVLAFKILKDAEVNVDVENNGNIKGLVGYLLEMERRELALKDKNAELLGIGSGNGNVIEGEFSDVLNGNGNETDEQIEQNELMKDFGIKKFINSEPDVPI